MGISLECGWGVGGVPGTVSDVLLSVIKSVPIATTKLVLVFGSLYPLVCTLIILNIVISDKHKHRDVGLKVSMSYKVYAAIPTL